jgi:hypothetical protein
MGLFFLAAIFLVPIGLVSGLLAIGWFWDFVSACFFSLSYYCGMSMSFRAALFAFISFSSFAGLVKLWSRSK